MMTEVAKRGERIITARERDLSLAIKKVLVLREASLILVRKEREEGNSKRKRREVIELSLMTSKPLPRNCNNNLLRQMMKIMAGM